jgi:prolyl-tRNA synthetase
VSLLALNAHTFPKVLTVLDASITSSPSTLYAVRALSSSSTVFLTGSDISTYLSSLETDQIKIHTIDLRSLADPSKEKATEKAGEKGGAKIDGAVQIAIGVKKEVDFAAWYTSVRLSSPSFTITD